jgi:hypothetical protein
MALISDGELLRRILIRDQGKRAVSVGGIFGGVTENTLTAR